MDRFIIKPIIPDKLIPIIEKSVLIPPLIVMNVPGENPMPSGNFNFLRNVKNNKYSLMGMWAYVRTYTCACAGEVEPLVVAMGVDVVLEKQVECWWLAL